MEAILHRKISAMIVLSIVGSLVGWYLGRELVAGPFSPPGRVLAGSIVGAVAVSGLFSYLFSLTRKIHRE
jgi:uncharacterized membrane protein YeaQ/YmgE (transglycosylase-associated protein family)